MPPHSISILDELHESKQGEEPHRTLEISEEETLCQRHVNDVDQLVEKALKLSSPLKRT